MVDLNVKENYMVVLVHTTPEVSWELLSPPSIPRQEWVVSSNHLQCFPKALSWMAGVITDEIPGCTFTEVGMLETP